VELDMVVENWHSTSAAFLHRPNWRLQENRARFDLGLGLGNSVYSQAGSGSSVNKV
jgi:hypothetical protein